jgi:hypothetical protein
MHEAECPYRMTLLAARFSAPLARVICNLKGLWIQIFPSVRCTVPHDLRLFIAVRLNTSHFPFFASWLFAYHGFHVKAPHTSMKKAISLGDGL